VLAIMGSEEDGVREKTLGKCSQICTLSKNQTINSLNVSVATGVILFEIARQKLI
jgi:23S rRNA (guanosine2251-2'-O)-methyltransferase